jgi:hypothetical protein
MVGVGRSVVMVLALAAPLVGSAAWASPQAGDEFGQHVRECAQQVGFSGEHNPGMHRGAAGWDGMACHD